MLKAISSTNQHCSIEEVTKYGFQLSVAIEAARLGGNIIKNKQNKMKLDVSTKVNDADLVTEVDKEVEQVITRFIRQHFPCDLIIGEEEFSSTSISSDNNQIKKKSNTHDDQNKIPSNKNVWCIDPIDGTTNFVHNFPMVNVSIGYCAAVTEEMSASTKRSCQPTVGVIFNPFLNEMYHAERGHGAYCNGKPIHVDHTSNKLSNCLLINNIGHTRRLDFIEESTKRVSKWLQAGLRGFRSTGSAAQNMAYVACGKVSCFYEHGFGGPWDVCAGIVLIQEAGGVVKDAVSSDDLILCNGKGSVCCGNAKIVKEVLKVAGVPQVKFVN